MKKPKCRLCHTEHYSHEPHAFDTAVRPGKNADEHRDKPPAPNGFRPQKGRADQVPGAGAADNHGAPKTVFDRAAYQKDYMKNTYRPRIKAKREAEAAELARLRDPLKEAIK